MEDRSIIRESYVSIFCKEISSLFVYKVEQVIFSFKFLQPVLDVRTFSYTIILVKDFVLNAKWLIKAPLTEVFNIITDFEKWPKYFPKVAESIQVTRHERNNLEIDATVKSFGQLFPVKMKTEILPKRGFISDNESSKFGTSGHEELLLSESLDGTMIDYTYQVAIHKPWLRMVARPLIGWFSMKYWQKAVIDELRKMLEK